MADEKKTTPKRRRAKRGKPAAVTISNWSPATDRALVAGFSAARPAGKTACKAALQAELGLKPRSRTPVFLYVGELERAAGFDLVLGALPGLLKIAAQAVVLAPRRGALAEPFEVLAREHGDRLVLVVEDGEKDETLLRRALAGGDLLLLPAANGVGLAWRGLRYGVLPVALANGEAAALLSSLAAGSSKAAAKTPSEIPGFLFRSASALALGRAAQKGAAAYREAVRWRRLRRKALQVPELESVREGAPAGAPGRMNPAPRAVSPVMTLAQAAHQFDVANASMTEPTGAPYVDWGPPPPERYGEDALELLVQSPRRLYGYWEVAPARLAQTGGARGLQLVLHDGRAERLLATAVADFGDWWVDAEPDREYRLELRSSAGVKVLESGRVKTPREDGSPREEVQFVSRPEPHRGAERGSTRSASAPAKASVRRITAAAAVGAKQIAGKAKPAAGKAAGMRSAPSKAEAGSDRPAKTSAAAPPPHRSRIEGLAHPQAPASEERPRKGREEGSGTHHAGSSGAPPRGRK